MRCVTVTAELVDHVRKFLGEDGREFFERVKREHGRYNAVFWPSEERGMPDVPHPVHFREGMQVRNAMRKHPDCAGWDAHDFDGSWVTVVTLALEDLDVPLPVEVEIEAPS